jgi:flagellar biosynthesis protein FlhG
MHDQANKLRNLVLRAKARLQPPGPPPRLVVLTGGKGGVGTTTLAINVSAALAQLGKRVVLVDADLHRGDVAALCGLNEDYSVADVMSAHRTVHEVLQRGPAGIQIVPGAWAPNKPVDSSPVAQQRLIQQLQALGRHADVVLLDAGSGASESVQRYWQAADRVLLVSTADSVSIMDTYATIKVLAGDTVAADVGVVINRVADAEQADRVQARIEASCRRFLGRATRNAGCVIEEPELAEAGRAGAPLAIDRTRHCAAQGIARIAAALATDPGRATLAAERPQRNVA